MVHNNPTSSFILKASSIQATFADGLILDLDNITIQESTPLGDEWILCSSSQQPNDDDGVIRPPLRMVKLILITPDHDWRKNQTYAWKLDNAWMSDPDLGWIHWNVEAYVDSQIQVPDHNMLLQSQRMEFHFRPIGMQSAASFPVLTTLAKLVLQDVEMGVHVSNVNDTIRYNPCYHSHHCQQGEGYCSIIDGVILFNYRWSHHGTDHNDICHP